MLSGAHEYERAQSELRRLEEWLKRLKRQSPVLAKGTAIRKMIARRREQLASYRSKPIPSRNHAESLRERVA